MEQLQIDMNMSTFTYDFSKWKDLGNLDPQDSVGSALQAHVVQQLCGLHMSGQTSGGGGHLPIQTVPLATWHGCIIQPYHVARTCN